MDTVHILQLRSLSSEMRLKIQRYETSEYATYIFMFFILMRILIVILRKKFFFNSCAIFMIIW